MRVNFEIKPERMKALKSLQDKCQARDMKDLINNALTSFEWMINQTEKGRRIESVSDGDVSTSVLVMPLLSNVMKGKE
jgi:hypothetical protein